MEALVSSSASALHAMGGSPAVAAGAQAFYCFVATLFTVFALDRVLHVVVAQGGQGAGWVVGACWMWAGAVGGAANCVAMRVYAAPLV
jgi:hypothetical protein